MTLVLTERRRGRLRNLALALALTVALGASRTIAQEAPAERGERPVPADEASADDLPVPTDDAPADDGSPPARDEAPAATDDEADEEAPADDEETPEEEGEDAPARGDDAGRAPADEAGRDDPQASFGGAAANTGENEAAETLSFNFRFAPWEDVLELFADAAGLTLDLEVVPSGTFSYRDGKPYTPTEALDVLNGYLLPRGYALVRRDDFLVSIDLEEGIPPNLVPAVPLEDLDRRGRNELVSVVIPLPPDGDPTEAAEEVQSILGAYGTASPLSPARAIVVQDTAANAGRIASWLTGVEDDPSQPEFRSYKLEFIAAVDAAPILREQLGVAAGVKNVSRAVSGTWQSPFESEGLSYVYFQRGRRGGGDDDDRRRRFYEMMRERRRDRDGGGDDDRRQRGSSSEETPDVKISTDVRTNSLLVTATSVQHAIAEHVIQAIDVPADPGYQPDRSSGPYLRVYKLEDADETEVAKTITALMEGVVVNEDRRADTVHIFGDDEVHAEVARLIRELDGAGRDAQTVAVVSLARMDPVAAASTIRSLFLKEEEDAPSVEADLYGRRLMIRGTSDQVTQIKSMLAQLGEDGSGTRDTGSQQAGPVRTLPLGGRDPEEFLPLLERLWEASNPETIRIVPTRRPAVRRRYPAEQDREPPRERAPQPAPNPPPEDDAQPSAETDRDVDLLQPVSVEEPDAESDEPADDEPEEPAEPDAAADPDDDAEEDEAEADSERPARSIALTLEGDTLVAVSRDEEALDRLEQLVDRLARAIPPATQWNVFYLRAADATETAAMLEQLFPASSVSTSFGAADDLFGGLTGGIESMGSSLMDSTGLSSMTTGTQTLRIVPDVRSNSLFVSGPPNEIERVEEVLQVLDASDLPDSLRERLPRMIPVEHADVDEVATIVRDVYRDYLTVPDQGDRRRGGNGNPLEALMGGGRGGRQQQQSTPRMTLGVDQRTSQLVVSASDPLFREVEELVARLDDSAKAAKRTVRVVRLDYAQPNQITSTVSSLIPKVTVGSTRPQTSPSRDSGPESPSQPRFGGRGRDDDGGGDDDRREAIRRFFEQRMRERGGGGDDGDRGGSRGRFGGRGGRDRDRGRGRDRD